MVMVNPPYLHPFPEFKKHLCYKATYVGGCVERGPGSSFRAKAHAHIEGEYKGWICVRSAKRLRTPAGKPSYLMIHELAHLVSGQGHTDKFRRVLRELGGRCHKKVVGEVKRTRRS